MIMIMIRCLLFITLGYVAFSFSVIAADLPKRQADMTKLLKGETRMVEVKRLIGLQKYNDEVRKMAQVDFEERMADVRVIKCPQKKGESLYLLMTKRGKDWYDFHREINDITDDNYPDSDVDTLFENDKEKKKPIPKDLDDPTSERFAEYSLSFFDIKGQELHPFGGDNFLTSGYIFDMDGDGILERLDVTNWGVADGMSVKSLRVETAEVNSKTLLHVVYEWHPDDAPESNEWTFELKDADDDGDSDILIGPKQEGVNELDSVGVTYLWDTREKLFTGPDGKKGDHFRRLYSDSFKTIKKLGGLGYQVIKEQETDDGEQKLSLMTRAEIMARKLHTLPDFKQMSMDELLQFFSSGETEKDKDEKGFRTVFPKDMGGMKAKDAALAFADANRNESHKKQYRLALDDRNGAVPPEKGWVVFTQHSASSYTYIEWFWAINIENHCLVYCANSSNGIVGSNPFLDEVGYDIRVITLNPQEAKYIANVLWWLNRIRSQSSVSSRDVGLGITHSSADGGASLYEFHQGKALSHFIGKTRWFGFDAGPSSRWDGVYNKEVCANLCGEFCEKFLPKYLGKRWSEYTKLEHRNLRTNNTEKIKKRHSSAQLVVIQRCFEKIFSMNSSAKVPAEILGWVARAAGDLGMHQITPQLLKIKSELNPVSAKEKELLALEKELNGKHEPFLPNANNAAELALAEKFKKLHELRNALNLHYDSYLRPRLEIPLKKLAAAGTSWKLTEMALSGKRDAFWAQQQLRRNHPDEYAEVLLEMLHRTADPQSKEQAIDLLIAFSPEKSLQLVEEMDVADKEFYCLNLLPLYQKKLPQKMGEIRPWVLAKALNKDSSWQHRHKAVRMLVPSIFPDDQDEIYPALVKIATEKEKKTEEYNPHPHSQCVYSLVQWPRARKQWKELKKIAALKSGQAWDQDEILRSLVELSVHCGPNAREEVQNLLEERLLNGMGLVGSQIDFIFSHGYRECLPLIERMATLHPEEKQNRWAVIGQSSMSHPTGRHSYHAARQLRALWGKYDTETDARIWAAKALQNPELFSIRNRGESQNNSLSRLGKVLKTKLEKEAEIKSDFLKRAENHQTYYSEQLSVLRDELSR